MVYIHINDIDTYSDKVTCLMDGKLSEPCFCSVRTGAEDVSSGLPSPAVPRSLPH